MSNLTLPVVFLFMEGQIPELVRDENSASRLPEIIVSDFRDMTEIFHDGRDRDSGRNRRRNSRG